MGIFFFRKRQKDSSRQKVEREPFEKREKVYHLSLFFTIINRDQSNYYIKAYQDAGASMSMVFYSHSQPPEEIANILGPDNLKKEIVMTITRSEFVPQMKEIAAKRFAISSAAKGIAFACPIDSVSGIAVYKFLADQNKDVRENDNYVR